MRCETSNIREMEDPRQQALCVGDYTGCAHNIRGIILYILCAKITINRFSECTVL
uniref:Uncharacterized protein n=1 Tax=Anguilla anguilla TaxID=7936 RepID=A0A0E9TV35_ANGAN